MSFLPVIYFNILHRQNLIFKTANQMLRSVYKLGAAGPVKPSNFKAIIINHRNRKTTQDNPCQMYIRLDRYL